MKNKTAFCDSLKLIQNKQYVNLDKILCNINNHNTSSTQSQLNLYFNIKNQNSPQQSQFKTIKLYLLPMTSSTNFEKKNS